MHFASRCKSPSLGFILYYPSGSILSKALKQECRISTEPLRVGRAQLVLEASQGCVDSTRELMRPLDRIMSKGCSWGLCILQYE